MKRIIGLTIIVISICLIGLGIYYNFRTDLKKSIKTTNVITIVEATNLLYSKYPIMDNNVYYSLVEENKNEYVFKLENGSENKKFYVNKTTKQVLVSYYTD